MSTSDETLAANAGVSDFFYFYFIEKISKKKQKKYKIKKSKKKNTILSYVKLRNPSIQEPTSKGYQAPLLPTLT